MSSARHLALLAFALVPVARAQSPELQYTQNAVNGHWYGFSSAPMTRAEGQAAARAAGGYLATIDSSAEQNWTQLVLGPYAAWRYWIGLNDVATEGHFVWDDGEPSLYANWAFGQPDDAGGAEDAVQIEPTMSWRWSDANADSASTTKPWVEVDDVPRVGWTLPKNVGVGNGPGVLASGDFNGDGRADVIVPNVFSLSATVVFGTPWGLSDATTSYPVPSFPLCAAVGDFDGDGHADWAVVCSPSFAASRVHVRFGNGQGSFAASLEIVLSSGGNGSGSSLQSADVDGDGLTDLAITSDDPVDRLQILRALPGRTFAAPVGYATGSRPGAITAGDLEGDGDLDLVVPNALSNDVSVFRNQGNGSFVGTASLTQGGGPGRVALADLDQDGLLDLAVPIASQGLVRIFFGAPGGNFVPGPAIVGGDQPTWTMAVDTNGDGVLDLVSTSPASQRVLVQEMSAGGAPSTRTFLLAREVGGCVIGVDLDGDNRTDLVASGPSYVIQLTKLSRDCNANGRDDDVDIALAGSTDCNGNFEPDECDLLQGVTFDCNGNGLHDACEILATPTLDLDSDGTIDQCEIAGDPFCSGDGTGTWCPCEPGQGGAPGSGCRNSAGNSGRLVAIGYASVANDSVTLRATGLLNSAAGLFFQGNAQQNAGFGSVFGDGLLCVNQSVVRLETRFAVSGAMSFGRDVVGDPSIAADGFVPAAGATRSYQVWYRDPAAYCTIATFNLTNGVRVVWTP